MLNCVRMPVTVAGCKIVPDSGPEPSFVVQTFSRTPSERLSNPTFCLSNLRRNTFGFRGGDT